MRYEEIETKIQENIHNLDDLTLDDSEMENLDFAPLLNIQENDQQELMRQAEHFVQSKEYQKALDIYLLMSVLKPTNADCHLKTGIILFKMEKYKEACELFGNAALCNEADPAPWLFLANCYDNLKENDKVETCLETCIEVAKLSEDKEAKSYQTLAAEALAARRR